jgi:hypothetical protein
MRGHNRTRGGARGRHSCAHPVRNVAPRLARPDRHSLTVPRIGRNSLPAAPAPRTVDPFCPRDNSNGRNFLAGRGLRLEPFRAVRRSFDPPGSGVVCAVPAAEAQQSWNRGAPQWSPGCGIEPPTHRLSDHQWSVRVRPDWRSRPALRVLSGCAHRGCTALSGEIGANASRIEVIQAGEVTRRPVLAPVGAIGPSRVRTTLHRPSVGHRRSCACRSSSAGPEACRPAVTGRS